jgi:anti-sigma28 factor (negative regulator of flagellin synthesis)
VRDCSSREITSGMGREKSKKTTKKSPMESDLKNEENKTISGETEISMDKIELIKKRIEDKFYERDDVLMEIAGQILKRFKLKFNKKYN